MVRNPLLEEDLALTMLVSQFTLFAQFKGTKPSFHESMVCPTA